MAFEQLAHGGDLFRNVHFDEANDAGVRQAAHENQFAEILVLGQEKQIMQAAGRHAGVEQKLHLSMTATRSYTCSPATTR